MQIVQWGHHTHGVYHFILKVTHTFVHKLQNWNKKFINIKQQIKLVKIHGNLSQSTTCLYITQWTEF